MKREGVGPDAFSTGHGISWAWSGEGCNAFEPRDRGIPTRIFKREFSLPEPEGAFLIFHVAADSRYEIFLNGARFGFGPGKGDLTHQMYDTYTLREGLLRGTNTLLVRVVDFSRVVCHPPTLGAPASVMTYRGGFAADGCIVEADGRKQSLGTPGRWLVAPDYSLDFQADEIVHGGFVGLFERWRCCEANMEGGDVWEPVTVLYPAVRIENRRDETSPYGLVPRRAGLLRISPKKRFGKSNSAGKCLVEEKPCHVPAASCLEVIFDAGQLLTGFPVLEFEGGAGATIRMVYAEALRAPWDAGFSMLGKPCNLGNVSEGYRDETTGWTYDLRGTLNGYSDIVETDGRHLTYRPMHWRTFRFVRLCVKTSAEPVTIRSLGYEEVSYPFPAQAIVEVSDPFIQALWDRGMRTVELCCHETFEDCPYYEQLQYAGDAAITSQLVLMAKGETGLVRQAIEHFAWSCLPEGIVQSRYPSRIPQVIPSWALHWIQMVHDYYLYSGDRDLVAGVLPIVKSVLNWFRSHRDDTGLPSCLPYWNTADWCPDWNRGQPPGWDSGPTSVISGQYVRALKCGAWLHREMGDFATADKFCREAGECTVFLRETFWNARELLFQDQPVWSGVATFSQYGNAWAVLAGALPEAPAAGPRCNFLFDPRLCRASFFGLASVAEALGVLGEEENLRTVWEAWKGMYDFGLDTWAEDTSYWRSLCHAWSAHPCLGLLHVAAGIKIIEPGYRAIRVEPRNLGLEYLSVELPTPHGQLKISWCGKGGNITELEVNAPSGIRVETRNTDPVPEESSLALT